LKPRKISRKSSAENRPVPPWTAFPFLVWASAVLLIAGLFFAGWAVRERQSTIRAITSADRNRILLISERTSSFLESMDLLLLMFREKATSLVLEDPEDWEIYRQSLLHSRVLYPQIHRVFVLDETGGELFSSLHVPPSFTGDLYGRIRLSHEFQKQQFHLDLNRQDKEVFLTFSQTLRDRIHNHDWILGIEIFSQALLFYPEMEESSNTRNILLFDSRGEVLTGLTARGELSLEERLLARDLYAEITTQDTGITGASSLGGLRTVTREGLLVTVNPLDGFPYTLVLTDDQDSALADWRTVVIRNLLLLLAVLALAIMIYFFLYRRRGEKERVRAEVIAGLEHEVRNRTEELKRQFSAARKNELKYRTLFTSMMEGFALHEIICDDAGVPADYRFLDINPAFQKLTGLDPSRVVGKTAREVFPNLESYWIERYGRTALTGEPRIFEDYAAPLGRYYRVIVYSPAERQFAVLFEDVTQRKMNEMLLEQERERLAVTLRSIGDGVIATDVQGKVVLLNDVAEELTGWTSRDARGRHLEEVFRIVHEYTRETCANPVEQVFRTGKIVELANHTSLISRDGTERIIADSGAPITGSSGEIVGAVLVFRDMTDKQRLSESIQRTQKLESLGILAGGIAHDFNNQLFGIFGYLEMADEYLNRGQFDRIGPCIQGAFGVFEHAQSLTRQLLTFAKGGAPIRKTHHLGSILEETVRFALSGSAVVPRMEIQPGLWSCNCDGDQIRQVIDNLVLNAKQAMSGKGELRISLYNDLKSPPDADPSARKLEVICLSIQDDGPGIPPELAAHIFDPFFSTKTTGHGLGLATVFSIVQRHDGWIELDSGRPGAWFRIYLPADREMPVHPEASGSAVLKRSGTILAMDDEPFILEILAGMLEGMGFRTTRVGNDIEALRLFTEAENSGNPFTACILDLTIPGGKGGKETGKRMREINPDTLLIASSGYSDDPVMLNPRDYGFSGCLFKPFRKKDLEQLLGRLLQEAPETGP